jgi:hypothetical protein
MQFSAFGFPLTGGMILINLAQVVAAYGLANGQTHVMLAGGHEVIISMDFQEFQSTCEGMAINIKSN